VAVTKSTDAVDGTYSCQLQNIEVLPGTVAPGVITTGRVELDLQFNPTFFGGAPYTEKPEEFVGKYKFNPGPSDTGMIQVLFTVYDTIAQASLPLGDGMMDLTVATTGWQTFNIPITYNADPRDPDTVLIIIASSRVGSGAPASTSLFVDSVGFSQDSASGVEPIGDLVHGTTLMPNPVSDEVKVITATSARDICIYTVTGSLIEMRKLHEGSALFSVSDYAAGLYLYSIGDSQGRKLAVGKFSVQR
jgi:hypothetical protein